MYTIQKRRLKSGLISLCAYNNETGKLKSLSLFLTEGSKLTKLQKQINKEVMSIAEKNIQKLNLIEAQKQSGNYVSPPEKKSLEDFILDLRRNASSSRDKLYKSMLNKLRKFNSELELVTDIDKSVCHGFNMFLRNSKLAQNSQAAYFETFRAMLKEAFRQGYLNQDLSSLIDGIKSVNNEREVLTREDIESLKATPCNEEVRHIAFASLITGMRFIDLVNLTTDNIIYSERLGSWVISFTQQKTKKHNVIPITEAIKSFLLREEGHTPLREKNLFKTNYDNTVYRMAKWFRDAGVGYKKCHFHVFRHTFANLQLQAGTDIFTLSGLLGHKSIQTTQIYAKPLEQEKIKAMANNTIIF